MQFPESWLREFCNPPLSTQALADTLTMAGLEVEELAPVAPPFTNIVVGEIKQVLADTAAGLVQTGAEVLGVICNRRRFYIPNWLYAMLG